MTISAVVSSYLKHSLEQVLSMYTSKRLKVSLVSSFGPQNHSAGDIESRNDFLRQFNDTAFSWHHRMTFVSILRTKKGLFGIQQQTIIKPPLSLFSYEFLQFFQILTLTLCVCDQALIDISCVHHKKIENESLDNRLNIYRLKWNIN